MQRIAPWDGRVKKIVANRTYRLFRDRYNQYPSHGEAFRIVSDMRGDRIAPTTGQAIPAAWNSVQSPEGSPAGNNLVVQRPSGGKLVLRQRRMERPTNEMERRSESSRLRRPSCSECNILSPALQECQAVPKRALTDSSSL